MSIYHKMSIYQSDINRALVQQGPEGVKRLFDYECGSDRQLGADLYWVCHGEFAKHIRYHKIFYTILTVLGLISIPIVIGILLFPMALFVLFSGLRNLKKIKKNWEQGYELWQRSLPTP